MHTLSPSFRDPSGFLFVDDARLLRQVNHGYADTLKAAEASGLLAELMEAGLLVSHQVVDHPGMHPDDCAQVLEPEFIPFISYPYEWSFSQLKDAALLTLDIQQRALDKGFTLKDASAYNVQFVGHKPVFIDSLSFEPYVEGQPWIGYRQFCQHFLAPLALMSKVHISLNRLLQLHIDGVPLDLAQSMLRGKSYFSLGLLSHIKLHAQSQQKYQSHTAPVKKASVKLYQVKGIVDHLRSCITSLTLPQVSTEWGDYYNHTNYTRDSFSYKETLVSTFIDASNPSTVWDLGANDGTFSRLADNGERTVVSCDIDPVAVEKHYLSLKKQGDATAKRLPLIMDLTNPSPGIGWHLSERDSVLGRGPADMCLALALIHHLAISHNVPLPRLAAFFSDCAKELVIEFVPKEDSQVQTLLATREDIFDTYDAAHFEAAFGEYFTCEAAVPVEGSHRTLYHFKRK